MEAEITTWSDLEFAADADFAKTFTQIVESGKVTWINVIVSNEKEAERCLRDVFKLHPVIAEAVIEQQSRPTLHRYNGYSYGSFSHLTATAESDIYDRISTVLRGNVFVTLATKKIDRTADWIQPALMESTPTAGSTLFCSFVDSLIDDYFPRTDDMEDDIDDLQDSILQEQIVSNTEIISLKRRLTTMRRNITPTRDILNQLLRMPEDCIHGDDKLYVQELYDHALRIIERIDLNRELVSDVTDSRLAVISNNMNNVMKVLTVISTILMSVGLLSGIYGMNLKMPEFDWKFGYIYFWSLTFLIILAEVIWFRKKKWI